MRCFNIVNPKPSPWGHLPAVIKQYHAQWGLTGVGLSLDESPKELRAVDETKAAEHADRYPSLKLLDFFEGMKAGCENGACGVATGNGVEWGATMAGLGPIDKPLMRK